MAKHVKPSALNKLRAPNWSKNLKPIDLTTFQNRVQKTMIASTYFSGDKEQKAAV